MTSDAIIDVEKPTQRSALKTSSHTSDFFPRNPIFLPNTPVTILREPFNYLPPAPSLVLTHRALGDAEGNHDGGGVQEFQAYYTARLGERRRDIPLAAEHVPEIYGQVFANRGKVTSSKAGRGTITRADSLQYDALHDPNLKQYYVWSPFPHLIWFRAYVYPRVLFTLCV